VYVLGDTSPNGPQVWKRHLDAFEAIGELPRRAIELLRVGEGSEMFNLTLILYLVS
jgi:hypothetical protein